MKKYDLHVSLKPEIHSGELKHFWNITLTTSDGTFNVTHGYEKDLLSAVHNAWKKTIELKLN